MHAERPWWLLLLPVLVLPWVLPLLTGRAGALLRPLVRIWQLIAGRLLRKGRTAVPRGHTGLTAAPRPQAGLRPVVAGLLILALAGFSLSLPARHQAVLFVADRSASSSSARQAEVDWIQQALKQLPKGEQAGVLAFARETQVEAPVSARPSFQDFASVLDDSQTDISRALSLGAAVLPSGFRPHLVLLSDGRENLGSALLTAQRLHDQGATVDVVPIEAPKGPEALISRVDAPAALRKGETFSAQLTVHATVDQPGTLRIYDDRRLIESREIHLVVGDETLPIRLGELGPGYHRVWFTLAAQQDTLAQNNEAAALVNVEGPPKVMLVEAQAGASTNVRAALEATGYRVDLVTPDGIPTHAANLQPYGAVVLNDVPASALPAAAIGALNSFVREAGRGLVVLGGQNSYSMGGYAGTPLEELLPVRMDIPQRKKIPTVAVVLIIENLERQDKINISKEAAKGLLGLLGPSDQIAVNDAAGGWVVPLQPATDRAKISKLIDTMQTGDPPSYIPYLESAAQVLRESKAEVKHIIFCGDGDAQGASFEAYAQAITAIANDGITLSTVETNAAQPSEFLLMAEMARWGKGRSYNANDAASIPRIFTKEAQTTARPAVVEETFVPTRTSSSPILTGITAMPALQGYIALTARPTAEVALQTPEGDPLLAQWQVGLGRVVAWSSDSQGLWTKELVQAPVFAQLMSQAVGWTLPPPGEQGVQVTTTVAGGKAQISVQLPAPAGEAQPDWPVSLVAGVLPPDGTPRIVGLPATGPGLYEGEVPAAAAGPYLLKLSAVRGSTSVPIDEVGIVVPYSAEFREAGTDQPFLRQLAALGGGKVLSSPAEAWRLPKSDVAGQLPLSQWFLLLAALLWPVDIGLRRLRPGREEWQAALQWLAFWRRRKTRQRVMTATATAIAGVKARRDAQPATPEAEQGRVPPKAPAAAAPAKPTATASPAAASARSDTAASPAPPRTGESTVPTEQPGESTAFTKRLLQQRRQQGR